MLDGIEGIRVDTNSSDLSQPRYVVVAYRDGKAYLIMASSTGVDIASAFSQVLETWRWDSSR